MSSLDCCLNHEGKKKKNQWHQKNVNLTDFLSHLRKCVLRQKGSVWLK